MRRRSLAAKPSSSITPREDSKKPRGDTKNRSAAGDHGDGNSRPLPSRLTDWTCYRPRRHPYWLTVILLLMAGWIGFLLWMTCSG